MAGTKLTDDSEITYGKYKGTKMANILASYLLYCYDNDMCSGDVREYVVDNYDLLVKESEG